MASVLCFTTLLNILSLPMSKRLLVFLIICFVMHFPFVQFATTRPILHYHLFFDNHSDLFISSIPNMVPAAYINHHQCVCPADHEKFDQ